MINKERKTSDRKNLKKKRAIRRREKKKINKERKTSDRKNLKKKKER